MKDSAKRLLYEFICHPFMFLFMVIVVAPAYMLCLYEPDMNASDATVKQI